MLSLFNSRSWDKIYLILFCRAMTFLILTDEAFYSILEKSYIKKYNVFIFKIILIEKYKLKYNKYDCN